MAPSAPLSIRDLVVRDSDDVASAVRRLDANCLGVAFAVDDAGRFTGVVHADDLGPNLAPGAKLREAPRANGGAGRAQIQPVLDAERRPVDFTSPARTRRIPIGEPDLRGNELKYVSECVTTGWISSQGEFVRRFEREFAARLGVEHALAVSNGTVALHLALAAFGIGAGDEVIVPDLTFAATINTVMLCGATPVIVDIDPATWNMDPKAVARAVTKRTKAIMPVPLYGQPVDMDAINAIAAAHKLIVIEDAAEAVGASYRGTPCGALADSGCFSFFSNKVLTTGEGGMVVFRDPAVAQRARMLRDHGMEPTRRYWHNELGFNYRLTNLQAAVGCAQLERLDGFLTRKQSMARRYEERLSQYKEITLPARIADTVNSYWMMSILIDFAGLGMERDAFMERLSRAGVETRPLFYPLHAMPPYRGFAQGQSFPHSDRISAAGLSLPSGVMLSDDDIDYVCDMVGSQIRTRGLVRRLGQS